MNKVSILVFLVTIILLAETVSALDLEYYGIEDSIRDDLSVHHIITLEFGSSISHLDYNLAFEIFNLKTRANFDFSDCGLEENEGTSMISCDFVGITDENNQLIIEFETRDSIKELEDRYQFAANYQIPVPIERVFTLIRLPNNGRLAEDIINQSFFPRDGNVLTDGKNIMVFWEKENLTSGDNLQFSVKYTVPFFKLGNISAWLITGIVILIIVIIILAIFLLNRGGEEKVTKIEIVTSVLNDDERKLVDVLKSHEGKTGQKVLVRESGFSKAKVSRLVNSLKERNVIDVEPVSGRENIIVLKVEKTQ